MLVGGYVGWLAGCPVSMGTFTPFEQLYYGCIMDVSFQQIMFYDGVKYLYIPCIWTDLLES